MTDSRPRHQSGDQAAQGENSRQGRSGRRGNRRKRGGGGGQQGRDGAQQGRDGARDADPGNKRPESLRSNHRQDLRPEHRQDTISGGGRGRPDHRGERPDHRPRGPQRGGSKGRDSRPVDKRKSDGNANKGSAPDAANMGPWGNPKVGKQATFQPKPPKQLPLRSYGLLIYDTLASAKADLAAIKAAASRYDQLNIVIRAEGAMDDPDLTAFGKVFAGAAWTLIHERRKADGWYDQKH